jgi:predicted Zn-dependent protease
MFPIFQKNISRHIFALMLGLLGALLPHEYIATKNDDRSLTAQFRKIEAVIIKIGSISKIKPPLAICETEEPNAYVTKRDEPLRVTTRMLKMLGDDQDIMAALVGHEIAHLALGHMVKKAQMDVLIRNDANGAGYKVWSSRAAYSRQVESEADDLGIQFASKSGYALDGEEKLLSALLNAGVEAFAHFSSDHPGIVERHLLTYVRVEDEQFDQAAAKYLQDKQWSLLNKSVNQWLRILPKSPNAWYYVAKLRTKNKAKVLEALENTFTYSEPSLSKFQPEIDKAYMEMCRDLYSQGNVLQSAYCSNRLNPVDKEKFKQGTFHGYLFVGETEPTPLRLDFIREQDGEHKITNGDWPENKITSVTPAWKPVRFINITAPK